MGTLAQSDLWEFNKAYQIEKTAVHTRDIAESNRALVKQMEANLEVQKVTAQVQAYTASLVEHSNEILLSIGDELRSLGFEIKAVAGAIQNVESAVREQTDLHRKHYDAVQKEQALKEVIYNMKKYQTSLASSGDALAKAYGSKKLNDIIQQYGFSTRDLSSIPDKEYFDALKTECDRLWNALSEKEKEGLQDVEKLHFVTRELLDADIEEIAREFLPLEKIKGIAEPVLKRAPEPEIKKKYPRAFADPTVAGLLEKRRKTGRRMLQTVAAAAAGFVISMIVAINCGTPKFQDGKPLVYFPKEQSLLMYMNKGSGVITTIPKHEDVILMEEPVLPNGEKWLKVSRKTGETGYIPGTEDHSSTTDTPTSFMFFVFLTFFVCPLVWVVLFFSWAGTGGAIVRRSGLTAEMWKTIGKTYQAQVQEQRRLDEQYAAEYEKEMLLFRSKLAEVEGDVKRRNDEIEKRREELRNRHNVMLKEFRDSVNAFLKQHRPVQQFLPTL